MKVRRARMRSLRSPPSLRSAGSPDLVFPQKQALFVHGCFWHGHDCARGARMPQNNRDYWQAKISRNRARDKASLAALKKLGWTPRIIWECQTRDEAALSRLVQRQVGKRTST
jgi:DNA mismatch endonuclease (patch repair protein)